jgi:2-keto-3-deoxy-L-rhamnonate aldolase RhmA
MTALERLRSGEVVFGLMQTLADPAITELAVWSGYDFVILDAEHGMLDEAAQLAGLRAMAATDSFAMVRVGAGDLDAIVRVLDWGAEGVMVANVKSAEEATRIVFAANQRWSVGLRVDRYGLRPGGSSRPKAFIIALIESQEGVRAIDDILTVDGIEGIIIGPGDLSTDLGAPGDLTSAVFRAAVERVEGAARKKGRILGCKGTPQLTESTLIDRGYRLIIVDRDLPLIRDAFASALKAAKSA